MNDYTFSSANGGGNSFTSSEKSNWIDLDTIFDDAFFPPDLDYSSFLNDDGSTNMNMNNNGESSSSNSSSSSSMLYDNVGSVQYPQLISNDDRIMDDGDWDYLNYLGINPLDSNVKTEPNTFSYDEKIVAAKMSKRGLIQIPPLMPRARGNEAYGIKQEEKNDIKLENSDSVGNSAKSEEIDSESCLKKRKKMKSIDPKDMTEEQLVERRERNREHAKKSRIRKRLLLDLLQDQLTALRGENVNLRRVVIEKLPNVASQVFEQCTTEESLLLIDDDEISDEDESDQHILTDGNGNRVTIGNSRRIRKEKDIERRNRIKGSHQVHLRHHPDDGNATISTEDIKNTLLTPGELENLKSAAPKQIARILMEPDFRLIEALIHSQQNFVLSDPSLPDNPIVYCSEGFCKLTGYKRQHILGRNCRFLQGPGTDQGAVDIIRKGVLEGRDISVCLLNYKADGSPFWNQFFVAALRDSQGEVINYVGVQCEVNTLHIEEIKERVKRLPVPNLG